MRRALGSFGQLVRRGHLDIPHIAKLNIARELSAPVISVMPHRQRVQSIPDDKASPANAPETHLSILMDEAFGEFRFAWTHAGSQAVVATGQLVPAKEVSAKHTLDWTFEMNGVKEAGTCGSRVTSVRAMVRQIQRALPAWPTKVRIAFVLGSPTSGFNAGQPYELALPEYREWRWVELVIEEFARFVALWSRQSPSPPQEIAREAIRVVVNRRTRRPNDSEITHVSCELCITLNMVEKCIQLDWTDGPERTVLAAGRITCTGLDELKWELTAGDETRQVVSRQNRNSIRAQVMAWKERFPVLDHNVFSRSIIPQPGGDPIVQNHMPFGDLDSPWPWLENNVVAMADAVRVDFSPLARRLAEFGPVEAAEFERYQNRLLRKEQRRAEEEQRRLETMRRLAAERRAREQEREAQKRAALKSPTPAAPAAAPSTTAVIPKLSVPPVTVHVEMPSISLQETSLPLSNLRSWFLRERAARWWVSNQSDDLLALPYCRIERLEYQVRSALRVLGPLRGRALLSDEVGLGKTIEAGLVLKEWLTRGMVKRFLILTVPSLVDQWEEELSEKFNLAAATTNQPELRANTEAFWRENAGIVASLHTLKQPAHLTFARAINWDVVIVDEAHYLRNRESQAWQAVNALPRQFLLLLTATPVQNSLEELYNLVTLLQPGQLPTPKEFRARFVDPKRPRQPREPEELRRLLGQVMIRNTRANAGISLPPRRAETVLFKPEAAEQEFWRAFESELRVALGQLPAGQSSLWGRLLLQAAGSSPAAWRSVLERFPNANLARGWRERAPLESSWQTKCRLLPPLTRVEGGLVVFTQFLDTQSALAGFLQNAGVQTFVINGATPPEKRQPITEMFRERGGALLLSHSGTEGRNLQFCHRLVNFDLPWNPMEIEQRIGRLHRLGQRHPVRIYNLVQEGTLQEHLLEILQEKLNLFELVVGETGLILGERFSSDEFAAEVFRRWHESDGRVAEALQTLGDELAAARHGYEEVKQLDETLFQKDYESL